MCLVGVHGANRAYGERLFVNLSVFIGRIFFLRRKLNDIFNVYEYLSYS